MSPAQPQTVGAKWLRASGINGHSLLQAMDLAIKMVRCGDNDISVPDDTDENVVDKVMKIIQSYIGIANKIKKRKS